MLLLLFLILQVSCKDFDYPWKEREKYYFPDIGVKMKEVLNGKCASNYVHKFDNTILLPERDDFFRVSVFSVDKDIVKWWEDMPRPRQMRVDPYLCDAVYAKKLPIFNNTGCQLAHYMSPSAPRCQTKYLKWACDNSKIDINSAVSNNFILPESDHKTTDTPPQPWLLTAKNSFVSMCGQIAGKCGFAHTNANCMATGYKSQATAFYKKCPLSLVDTNNVTMNSVITCKGAPFSEHIEIHNKVFVVAEVDDTYVYHIHLEIMPRIIFHLDFLFKNPDIKILIGCDTKKGKGVTEAGLAQGLKSMKPFMDLIGLSMNRLIVHKHVYAYEIYLPMEGGCQDPVYNTWQILTMRKLFMNKLKLSDEKSKNRKPVMMLLKRSSGSIHTRNRFDLVRQWSDKFTEQILVQLRETFPRYNVVLFSDKNDTLMNCYGCQIQAFSEADVLIGVHGAGLSNMLYMKPNSAVVEFAPYGNDGRCLLGGGPFSRTAAVMSHNYMMHHPPYEEYKWITAESCSEFNITRFVVHIKSFLTSLSIE